MSAMKNTYHVRAVWDADAKVYFSESDIPGLNIEADTIEAFFEAVRELGPALLESNLSNSAANHADSQKRATIKSAQMELCYA